MPSSKNLKTFANFPDSYNHEAEYYRRNQMTTNYEGDDIEIKDSLPLLPVRDLVIYPFMILPSLWAESLP